MLHHYLSALQGVENEYQHQILILSKQIIPMQGNALQKIRQILTSIRKRHQFLINLFEYFPRIVKQRQVNILGHGRRRLGATHIQSFGCMNAERMGGSSGKPVMQKFDVKHTLLVVVLQGG